MKDEKVPDKKEMARRPVFYFILHPLPFTFCSSSFLIQPEGCNLIYSQ
jgi:hypothetical protein